MILIKNKLKLLTIFFEIGIVRFSNRIIVHIEGFDISLMEALVNHREVSLDAVDSSTAKPDI